MKIAVSACLMGDNVRYNGSNTFNKKLINLLDNYETVKVCPECKAGLSVPRNPVEIYNNRIVDAKGNDYTEAINKANTLLFEKIKDCDFAVLKQKSPTCGNGIIYDGSFSGKLIKGYGSFTKLCINNGMTVFSEEQIDEIREYIDTIQTQK